MMSNEKIDIILILTESGNHKNVIEYSKFGKNIIVEKPMALNVSDAELMIKESKANGIKLLL